jgi:hypothetical protein
MNHRIRTSFVLIIITTALGACSVKDAVPQFEYPVYTPDKEWPELVPTGDLVNATDVDVKATIEEVERLKRLAI